jgi:hypothetical protein
LLLRVCEVAISGKLKINDFRKVIWLFNRLAAQIPTRGGGLAQRLQAPSSGGRLHGTKFFPNRSGRIANPFDCARQLVFGHTKMPRPIFNMILMLDNDFAAVRSDCLTDDHVLRT